MLCIQSILLNREREINKIGSLIIRQKTIGQMIIRQMTIRQKDNSSKRQFVKKTICQKDYSSIRQFVNNKIRLKHLNIIISYSILGYL